MKISDFEQMQRVSNYREVYVLWDIDVNPLNVGHTDKTKLWSNYLRGYRRDFQKMAGGASYAYALHKKFYYV